MRPSANVDAKWFFLEGKYHGNARIAEMTSSEKAELVSSLERWLAIAIDK